MDGCGLLGFGWAYGISGPTRTTTMVLMHHQHRHSNTMQWARPCRRSPSSPSGATRRRASPWTGRACRRAGWPRGTTRAPSTSGRCGKGSMRWRCFDACGPIRPLVLTRFIHSRTGRREQRVVAGAGPEEPVPGPHLLGGGPAVEPHGGLGCVDVDDWFMLGCVCVHGGGSRRSTSAPHLPLCLNASRKTTPHHSDSLHLLLRRRDRQGVGRAAAARGHALGAGARCGRERLLLEPVRKRRVEWGIGWGCWCCAVSVVSLTRCFVSGLEAGRAQHLIQNPPLTHKPSHAGTWPT